MEPRYRPRAERQLKGAQAPRIRLAPASAGAGGEQAGAYSFAGTVRR